MDLALSMTLWTIYSSNRAQLLSIACVGLTRQSVRLLINKNMLSANYRSPTSPTSWSRISAKGQWIARWRNLHQIQLLTSKTNASWSMWLRIGSTYWASSRIAKMANRRVMGVRRPTYLRLWLQATFSKTSQKRWSMNWLVCLWLVWRQPKLQLLT